MIILSVNTKTKKAKLTSIMRDTWVKIDGHGSNKLNAACVFGGPDLTMSTINDHFDTNISQYVMVNISGLADIIDLLGGVELDVTKEERDALNKGLFDLSEYSGMEKLEKMYINQGWYQDGDFGRSLAYRFCGQLRVSAGRAVRLPV